MTNFRLFLIGVLFLGLTGYLYWKYVPRAGEPIAENAIAPDGPATVATNTLAAEETPRPIITPEPAPTEKYPVAPSTGKRAVKLPKIDESDPTILDRIYTLFGKDRFEKLFMTEDVVHRLVFTVANIAESEIPSIYLLLPRPLTDKFIADEGGQDQYAIAESNYARYKPYVDFIGSIDSKKAVALYRDFYPLMQKDYRSFEETGFFNDHLVSTIDRLLATPQPEGAVELTLPSVHYQFKDPELEALSYGQKLLIRMGPANAMVVKKKLREIRMYLIHLGKK